VFKNSPYVDNICVFGDSEKTFLVALVVPAKTRLTEWAEKNGIPEAADFEKVCNHRKARNEVLNSILAVGKQTKMKTVELPKDVHLCPEEWTPMNGMLTAAMKLKRAPVSNAFKPQIKQMYDELDRGA